MWTGYGPDDPSVPTLPTKEQEVKKVGFSGRLTRDVRQTGPDTCPGFEMTQPDREGNIGPRMDSTTPWRVSEGDGPS